LPYNDRLAEAEGVAMSGVQSEHESSVWPHAHALLSQTVVVCTDYEVFSHDEVVGQQWCDDVLGRVILYVKSGQRPSRREQDREAIGRVLRLPVEVIFGSVFDHHDIADYGWYVQTFRKDLREAMDIAQDMSSRQLQHHTDLYNQKGDSASHEEEDMSFRSGSLTVDGDGEAGCDMCSPVLHRGYCNDYAEYRTRVWVSDLPSEVSSELLLSEVIQPEDMIVDLQLLPGSISSAGAVVQDKSVRNDQLPDSNFSGKSPTCSPVLESDITNDYGPDCASFA
ncbi:hypothetical protein CRENBAI_012308, partial [Crenichthys baileyi]